MPDIKAFKSLFETPKKARITVICSLVALATLGAIIVYIVCSLRDSGADAVPPSQTEAVSDAPAQSSPPNETAAPTQTVAGAFPALTIEEARNLALADAGVSESEADVSREALAQDNGSWVYEFRFRTEQAQYEYKLNADTGKVLGMVKEIFAAPGPEASAPLSSPPSADTGSVPPEETAPQSSPAPESVRPTASPAPATGQPTSMYIGSDRAKAIALDHAGLSSAQVRFTHIGMDRENGTVVYEIEFRQGGVEYEYEIDAATGRILNHERDAD